MNGIPEELATVVRQAAATVPPRSGDLDEVLRRHRIRRRRRTAATAVLAVAVFAVTAGAAPRLVRSDTAPDRHQVATSATPPTFLAQRLLLSSAGVVLEQSKGQEVGIAGLPGVGEVLADGSVVNYPVPGVDGWYQIAALPDGRLVVLGYKDLLPGVPRKDGVNVTGLSVRLEVLGPDGKIERSREVRRPGEHVALVGASDREAYLMRSGELIAHDLATGAERVLLRKVAIDIDAGMAFADWMDVRAGLAVLKDSRPSSCSLQVIDLATTRQRELPLKRLSCGMLEMLRLSPDGRLVAVSYANPETGQARLAVLDTASGAVRVDRALWPASQKDKPRQWPTVAGIAWSDARTVRVAWTELPENANRVYRVDEVLQVTTIRS